MSKYVAGELRNSQTLGYSWRADIAQRFFGLKCAAQEDQDLFSEACCPSTSCD